MKKLLLPIITVCCLAPVVAFAGQQHPLVTDMAQTVAPSKFEAETAMEYHSYDSASIFVLQETVTAGIIPKMDAFITVPILSVNPDFPGADTESGFGDVNIGIKYNFMNVDKTVLSVKPFLVLPVGDDKKGLGEGGVGFGAVAIASLELDKQITIDGNIMLKHQDTEGDSYNEFGLSVAGKYKANKDLTAVAEIAFLNSDASGSDLRAVVTAGAVFEVKKNIDVDCGLRLGLTDDSEDFALLAGVTFKF